MIYLCPGCKSRINRGETIQPYEHLPLSKYEDEMLEANREETAKTFTQICSLCGIELDHTLSRKELKGILFRQQLERLPETEKFLSETEWVDTALPAEVLKEIREIDKPRQQPWFCSCGVNGEGQKSSKAHKCEGSGDRDAGDEPDSPAEKEIEEEEDFDERVFG